MNELQVLLLRCGLFTDDEPRAKRMQKIKTAEVVWVSHLCKKKIHAWYQHILGLKKNNNKKNPNIFFFFFLNKSTTSIRVLTNYACYKQLFIEFHINGYICNTIYLINI